MKKILITGCAGFIGSHLSEQLLNEGHQVIGIDNFSRFYDRSIKERNLSNFKSHENFSFHELDIRDAKAIHENLREDVDAVIHIAAKAGVRPSISAPSDYIDVNIDGTKNILEWMCQHQCKKMLFASSSSVYGNQEQLHPFKEDQDDCRPISPYAFTKRAAELANHVYHHLYDIDILNLRFFTVYGPRQRPDLAIHKFVKLIAADQPIQIFGNGETARDYTHINDIIKGLKGALNYLLNHSNVYEIVNLGNHQPIILKDLVKIIYEKMGQEPNLTYTKMQEGDVNITYADIEKAKQLFHYQPTTSIEDGIADFVAWFKKVNAVG